MTFTFIYVPNLFVTQGYILLAKNWLKRGVFSKVIKIYIKWTSLKTNLNDKSSNINNTPTKEKTATKHPVLVEWLQSCCNFNIYIKIMIIPQD